jgi:hypothetical protein
MASMISSRAARVGLEVRRESALVTHGGGEVALAEHLLQGVEGLDPGPQGVGEGAEAHRHDHELLEVHGVVSVGAAVEDVHHGHGQLTRAAATEVLVQRQARGLGRGVSGGQGHGEDGVGAHVGLVVRAVALEHGLIDTQLIAGVQTVDGVGQGAVDVLDGGDHALAEIAAGVLVAQLEGLAGAGGGAGRHDGAPDGAAGEHDFGLHGGIAARVEHFTSGDELDIKH